MKERVKISNLLIIPFLIIGCEMSNNTFTIEGELPTRSEGVVRISQVGESFFDSKEIEIIDGKFYYQGAIDTPEEFSLVYEENGPSRNFESFQILVEPSSTIEVVLFPDSIKKSRIKGSELATEFFELNRKIEDEYYDPIRKLVLKYQDEMSEDKEIEQMVISKAELMEEEVLQLKQEYIRNNTDSYISANLLHSFYLNEDDSTVAEYFALLNPSLSKSKYYKRVETHLSVLPGNLFVDFELSDGAGKSYTFSEVVKNKVVLIDFWASWCKPCRVQNKTLTEIYDANKSKGFEIVGVSIDRDTTDFYETIADDELVWLNLLDRIDESSVSNTYRSQIIPSNVLINREGVILDRNIPIEELEKSIQSVINE